MSSPLPGTLLSNRYEIVRKLGAGGLGEVYECLDLAKNQRVAVKRLHQSAIELGYTSETAANEAMTLSVLRHKHIVKVYDLAWDSNSLNIVMELVEGRTLANIIKQGPLQLNEFIVLATQSLEGLGAAHRKGLLHLDIKPANLMLEPAPNIPFNVKLVDFGLAQIRNQAPNRTSDGSIMGSIYFIAPEQLHADPLTEKTDLYALGHVFYNALAGRVAFPFKNFDDVIQAQLYSEPTPLGDLCPDAPKELCEWIHGFLNKELDNRPVSTQEALRNLTSIITSLEISKTQGITSSNNGVSTSDQNKQQNSFTNFIKDRLKL
ncbi:MAG: serine/threonine-protein kinase [Verrucomicrobiota bacterium]